MPWLPVEHQGQVSYPHDLKEMLERLNEIDEELHRMWTKVFAIKDKIRTENLRRKYRFRTANIQFGVGDYVVMSTKDLFKSRPKESLNWISPMLVTDVTGHNLYEVTDYKGKTYSAHSMRSKYYAGGSFQLTEEVKAVYLDNVGQLYILGIR